MILVEFREVWEREEKEEELAVMFSSSSFLFLLFLKFGERIRSRVKEKLSGIN